MVPLGKNDQICKVQSLGQAFSLISSVATFIALLQGRKKDKLSGFIRNESFFIAHANFISPFMWIYHRPYMWGYVLGMCYILCMCVCVGASNTTTVSDDPFT
jgi:Ca2+/Na+ antiporter